jgi:hypothetical protein
MLVQPGALAGFGNNQEEGDADATAIHPDELVGHPYKRQLRLTDHVHIISDAAVHQADSSKWPDIIDRIDARGI